MSELGYDPKQAAFTCQALNYYSRIELLLSKSLPPTYMPDFYYRKWKNMRNKRNGQNTIWDDFIIS